MDQPLDFETDPDLNLDQLFHFSITESSGILGIKQKLNELHMNVYEIFRRLGLQLTNNQLNFAIINR